MPACTGSTALIFSKIVKGSHCNSLILRLYSMLTIKSRSSTEADSQVFSLFNALVYVLGFYFVKQKFVSLYLIVLLSRHFA